MDGARVRALEVEDEASASRLLGESVGGRRQVRLGEVHDVLALPGFIAEDDQGVVGVATYAVGGRRGAVDVSRALKPEIPVWGSTGSRCATTWFSSGRCRDGLIDFGRFAYGRQPAA